MSALRSLVAALNPLGTFVSLAMIALWQVLVDVGVLSFQFLPSPTGVASGLREVAESGDLTSNLLHTVGNVLASWGLAVGVGLPVGFAIGLSRAAWRWSMASIEVLRTIPVIALVPPALLIFGLSSRTEILVAAYAAVWPVLISAASGARATPARLDDVAETFQLSRVRRVRKVTLPAAVPTILVGARLALTIALVLVIVAEMIGPPEGLGYAIVLEQRALQPEQMWAYLIVIGLLGVALNAALNGVARWRLPGFAPLLDTDRA